MMTITYDGAAFCGFQVQKSGRTVQGELEHALKVVLKDDISCVASGRTDAGVHAVRQYVHFETNKKFEISKLMRSLNGIMGSDIKIMEIKKSALHARFDAKRKTYLYKMYKSVVELPLIQNRAFRISKDADLKKFKKACSWLKGTHDFANFCAAGSEVKTTVRTIYDCQLQIKSQINSCHCKEHSDAAIQTHAPCPGITNNIFVNFYITGNGFLYKMVRNIVGLLLEFAEGKIADKKTFLQIAFSKDQNKKSKLTKPPYALYLLDVEY